MKTIKNLIENYQTLENLSPNTISYLLKEVDKESIKIQEDYSNAPGLSKALHRRNLDQVQKLEEIFDMLGLGGQYNQLRGNKRGFQVKIHFQDRGSDKVYTDSREVYYSLHDKKVVGIPYVIDVPNSLHPEHARAIGASDFRKEIGRKPKILRIEVTGREESPDGYIYTSGKTHIFDYGKYVHPGAERLSKAIDKAVVAKRK